MNIGEKEDMYDIILRSLKHYMNTLDELKSHKTIDIPESLDKSVHSDLKLIKNNVHNLYNMIKDMQSGVEQEQLVTVLNHNKELLSCCIKSYGIAVRQTKKSLQEKLCGVSNLKYIDGQLGLLAKLDAVSGDYTKLFSND